MVETEGKTKLVRTMRMKRIQPTGNIRELMSRPRDVAALVMKMKVRMRIQEENKEGQSTK